MLDPRRLAVLRQFAAQGTIAGAADSLAFTPSAVSQQLAQLQREAGVVLFRKAGRRLELTDAGHTLVARAGAADLLEDLERLIAILVALLRSVLVRPGPALEEETEQAADDARQHEADHQQQHLVAH